MKSFGSTYLQSDRWHVQRRKSWKNKVNMIFIEVAALVTAAIVLLAKKRKFRTNKI